MTGLRKTIRILVATSTFPRRRGDPDPPFVLDLCRALSDRFDVHVLAPHAPGTPTVESMGGVKVFRFRYFLEKGQQLAYGGGATGGGMLANLKQRPWRHVLVPPFLTAQLLTMVRLHRRYGYDLVHAHWLIPQGLTAVVASRFVPRPFKVLCTSHGADLFALRGRLWAEMKAFVAERSEGLTVVSRAMQDELLTMGDFKDKLRVIPMGVDLRHRFVPPSGKRSPKSLLFVGRLVEKKGLQDLIEAMPRVLSKHPDAFLTVAGSGPEESPVRNRVKELRLGDSIRLVGGVPNEHLAGLYQSSEILVFPSAVARDGDQEGFGLVLVEAMGCECAVVATDLAAIRDIVSHRRTGLVARQRDPSDLAEKIVELLDHPAAARQLGQAGREHVLGRFDWREIARRYGDFIQTLAGVE